MENLIKALYAIVNGSEILHFSHGRYIQIVNPHFNLECEDDGETPYLVIDVKALEEKWNVFKK